MKTRLVFIFFLLSISLLLKGQNDPRAVKILDKFSAVALNAPSVSMKFDLVTADKSENRNDTIQGSILISGNKYKLELPDNTIWFNGEISWSFLPVEKEVTITRPGKKDDSFQSRPSAIFTMYKKGYKSLLVEERQDVNVVDLYPEDLKSDFIRIRLTLAKSTMNLTTLEYKKKDGVIITLVVKEYSLKIKPEPDYFIFYPEKYKGVEIVDMR